MANYNTDVNTKAHGNGIGVDCADINEEHMRKTNETLSIRVVAASERSESLSRDVEESALALDTARHDNARLVAMNKALEDELLIAKTRVEECRHIIRLMMEF